MTARSWIGRLDNEGRVRAVVLNAETPRRIGFVVFVGNHSRVCLWRKLGSFCKGAAPLIYDDGSLESPIVWSTER
jgi:hypothetical protein